MKGILGIKKFRRLAKKKNQYDVFHVKSIHSETKLELERH